MSIISLVRLSSSLLRYYHVHHFSWEVVFFSSPVLYHVHHFSWEVVFFSSPIHLWLGRPLLLFPGTTMSIISLVRLSSSLLRYYHVHHFSWEVVFLSSPVLYHVHHFSWEVVFFSSRYYHVHHFSWEVVFFSSPVLYHVHHFSWEVVFFSSPIHLWLGRPLLLFPGTTMSIISLERLSSSLLRMRLLPI